MKISSGFHNHLLNPTGARREVGEQVRACSQYYCFFIFLTLGLGVSLILPSQSLLAIRPLVLQALYTLPTATEHNHTVLVLWPAIFWCFDPPQRNNFCLYFVSLRRTSCSASTTTNTDRIS